MALVLLGIGLAISGYEYLQSEATLQALESRPFYRPLDPELRESLVGQLRGLTTQSRYRRFTIRISVNAGSAPRLEFAQQIASILRDAGFPSSVSVMMIIPSNPPTPLRNISIAPNPNDIEPARAIAESLRGLVHGGIPVISEPERPRGVLRISLNGDPLFSPEGRVRFR
ncbi:MAG: hypothetical protein GY937_26530 [bacterium]|nr:hypothetical protein [bacterium]